MNKQFIDFQKRFNTWIEDNDIKQKDIADICEVTKGYISSISNGRRTPSESVLKVISEMSGKSIHWWMFGKEKYDNLDSLNMMINTLIDTGDIKRDGSMRKEIREIINRMIDKEIQVKFENLEDEKKAHD